MQAVQAMEVVERYMVSGLQGQAAEPAAPQQGAQQEVGRECCLMDIPDSWLDGVPLATWEELVEMALVGMSYLAAPITDRVNLLHPRNGDWVRMAVRATMRFKDRGCAVFTPSGYTYRMRKAPPQGWYKWDLDFLRASARVIILDIPPSTAASYGCHLEYETAKAEGIPVYRLNSSEVPE